MINDPSSPTLELRALFAADEFDLKQFVVPKH
jgi:hypothetical protein